MCCFSIARDWWSLFPPKVHVWETNIFARFVGRGVQAVAYGMNIRTSREVAMVLPLPIKRGAGDDALRFVDLARHPRMFGELADLFPRHQVVAMRMQGFSLARAAPEPKLVVYDIGSFEASFVPSRADFHRIDPRFRIPDVLFDAVPHYDDYGFAVFQLKPGKVTVHPMGLTFRTREPFKLFFPTVHLHDGTFERNARFNHALYYQRARNAVPISSDEKSTTLGATYEGLVAADHPLQRRSMHARLPNEDTWIPAA